MNNQVDNMHTQFTAGRASALEPLMATARKRAKARPFYTPVGSNTQYNGKRPNAGRYDWRITGTVLGSDCGVMTGGALVKPPTVLNMIYTVTACHPGEWTAWIHFPVRVHHMTARYLFKGQGAFMITGVNNSEFPVVDNVNYFLL